MSVNYTKKWKRARKTTGLPDIAIRSNDIASMSIDAALAALAIFVIGLPIWALPIAFIVCDIAIQTPIDFVIGKLIPSYRQSKQNDIEWLKKRNKKLDRLATKYFKTKGESHYSKDAWEIYHTELKNNEARIKSLEEENAKKQEELRREQDVYQNITDKKMEQVKDVVSRLKEAAIPDALSNGGVSLRGIVQKSKEVKNMLKQRPDCIDRTANTFILYGSELLDILDDINGMDPQVQASYVPRVKEAVAEYEKYLDRTKERIEQGEAVKTTVDLNVLINELKNNNS